MIKQEVSHSKANHMFSQVNKLEMVRSCCMGLYLVNRLSDGLTRLKNLPFSNYDQVTIDSAVF